MALQIKSIKNKNSECESAMERRWSKLLTSVALVISFGVTNPNFDQEINLIGDSLGNEQETLNAEMFKGTFLHNIIGKGRHGELRETGSGEGNGAGNTKPQRKESYLEAALKTQQDKERKCLRKMEEIIEKREAIETQAGTLFQKFFANTRAAENKFFQWLQTRPGQWTADAPPNYPKENLQNVASETQRMRAILDAQYYQGVEQEEVLRKELSQLKDDINKLEAAIKKDSQITNKVFRWLKDCGVYCKNSIMSMKDSVMQSLFRRKRALMPVPSPRVS